MQVAHTCGEVQQAKVGVHDGLLPDAQQADARRGGRRGGRLHLPDQQQHLSRCTITVNLPPAHVSLHDQAGTHCATSFRHTCQAGLRRMSEAAPSS